MKEIPILMSGLMVRAILEDRKFNTRRIIKPSSRKAASFDFEWIADGIIKPYNVDKDGNFLSYIKCPFGRRGDVLWVKETWSIAPPICPEQDWLTYLYRASEDYYNYDYIKWKPSIFMPREACRIKLMVEAVRVERLQDISDEDAVAEGVEASNKFEGKQGYLRQYKDYSCTVEEMFHLDAYDSYQTLWESIYGKGLWEKNPWVWVITFNRIGHKLTIIDYKR